MRRMAAFLAVVCASCTSIDDRPGATVSEEPSQLQEKPVILQLNEPKITAGESISQKNLPEPTARATARATPPELQINTLVESDPLPPPAPFVSGLEYTDKLEPDVHSDAYVADLPELPVEAIAGTQNPPLNGRIARRLEDPILPVYDIFEINDPWNGTSPAQAVPQNLKNSQSISGLREESDPHRSQTRGEPTIVGPSAGVPQISVVEDVLEDQSGTAVGNPRQQDSSYKPEESAVAIDTRAVSLDAKRPASRNERREPPVAARSTVGVREKSMAEVASELFSAREEADKLGRAPKGSVEQPVIDAASEPSTVQARSTQVAVRETAPQLPRQRESPSEGVKRVSAYVGEQISPVYNGLNWLFMASEPDNGGLRYISREVGDETTAFVFLAEEAGEYTLAFQHQDNTRGVVVAEFLRVDVMSLAPERGLARNSSEKVELSSDLTLADSLYSLGNYEASLAEYLSRYEGDDPLINDRIAELSFKTGNMQQAIAYWRRNLAVIPSEYAVRAIQSIVQAIPTTGDPVPILDKIELALAMVREPEALLLLAQTLYESDHYSESAQIYEHMLAISSRYRGRDRVYFMLGKLYETASLRDEKKAHGFYSLLLERHPASRYYEEANERAQYLDRHFLRVR